MEKILSAAQHLLRFLLNAALNSIKELGKGNRANVAVLKKPQQTCVLKKLQNLK